MAPTLTHKIDYQTLETKLACICRKAASSVILSPQVEIADVSVTSLWSPRFDSQRERLVFVVRLQTNDAAMVRGDINAYKGGYKERIEAVLDFHAKEMYPDCEVHVEIDGPNTNSVERLIPVVQLIAADRLTDGSPIVETARRFSIPDVLIRGRHLIAPSPTIASYIEHLSSQERFQSALDLFGGTGLAAKAFLAGDTMKSVTVVERNPAHLEQMKTHLKDKRVEFVLADAFNYEFRRFDVIVADPYYEDAMNFLELRLDAVLKNARVFVFVPGKLEDIRWNNEIDQKLRSAGSKVQRWDAFGQVLFDVRP